jgi:uncharacterized coiled-coil DUF342 family protein
MNQERIDKVKAVNEQLSSILKEVNSIKEENAYMKKALDRARYEADEERSKNKELQVQLEGLKMAKVISGEEPIDKHARTKINEMVKEIDRCIALMNN